MKTIWQTWMSTCVVALAGIGPARAIDHATSEKLMDKIAMCWNIPDIPTENMGSIHLVMRLNRDGSLAEEPRVENASNDQNFKLMAASAIRAIQHCAPFGLLLANPYDQWKEIKVNFDLGDFQR